MSPISNSCLELVPVTISSYLLPVPDLCLVSQNSHSSLLIPLHPCSSLFSWTTAAREARYFSHSAMIVLAAHFSALPSTHHANHAEPEVLATPHRCHWKPITQPHSKSSICLWQQAELLSFYHHYLVKIYHFSASSWFFWLTSSGLDNWMLFIVSKLRFDYKGKQSIW